MCAPAGVPAGMVTVRANVPSAAAVTVPSETGSDRSSSASSAPSAKPLPDTASVPPAVTEDAPSSTVAGFSGSGSSVTGGVTPASVTHFSPASDLVTVNVS